MRWHSTTYVGFHGGIWTPKKRTDVDAVATLKYDDLGLIWDIPSRRAPRELTGVTLHPSVLDQTIFDWFFNTLLPARHVVGIDAPFGWPRGLRPFLDGAKPSPMPEVEDVSDNPVLYREADRFAERLLGVEPETMLHHGNRATKMQTVVRILQERVGAHVAFVGRATSGTWSELDTILVETDPILAMHDPRFKQRRRKQLAQIEMKLANQGEPRLKKAEKLALSSALIALELDQAICNPEPSRSVYLIPDGMLPVGDAVRRTAVYDGPDNRRSLVDDLGDYFDWQLHLDPDLLPHEGFPSYPIVKRYLERVDKKSRRSIRG
ncbi:MAG: DUF429 domain-containing protein [Candidatus Kapabacteria bacterium]|nr:DUF429 domain-containing protein [Candidatus Kapabacteria bacterium]